ncbi:MAG: hypothetical protein ACTSXA_04975 [Candidatus Heimdallarchaeota archaeon]
MEKTETTLIQEDIEYKPNKFKESPMVAKISFLTAFVVILMLGLLMTITALSLVGVIGVLVFGILTLIVAIVGVILGGVSFRYGKNGFGIIGFILNLTLVVATSVGIYQAINLLKL